jgi:hypothetical protein
MKLMKIKVGIAKQFKERTWNDFLGFFFRKSFRAMHHVVVLLDSWYSFTNNALHLNFYVKIVHFDVRISCEQELRTEALECFLENR